MTDASLRYVVIARSQIGVRRRLGGIADAGRRFCNRTMVRLEEHQVRTADRNDQQPSGNHQCLTGIPHTSLTGRSIDVTSR
ncbi:hypothetical protein [Burkholderia sp. Ac-20353]|uniref:hypothetical protein n=1 Tax=Burkholderia sp. Ac-20353 TaxID=2703894 RepID=UPI00197C71CD|nr:hypothetical protein [Burkholderia sp. Ac-20353]